MESVILREKLDRMRQKYLGDDAPKADLQLSDEEAEKFFNMKKKLINLEKERCMRIRDNKDITAIDEKIAKQKERCKVFYREKHQESQR